MRSSILFILFIILATINNATSQDRAATSIEAKKAHCQEVLDKLKKTKGILSRNPPHIQMGKSLPDPKFALAMADLETGMISIEERTYDLCIGPENKMGKDSLNGLAFILAHELAHFTKEHNARHQFIEKFDANRQSREIAMAAMNVDTVSEISQRRAISRSKMLARRYKIKSNEAEADLDAGFTSYLAGFKTKEAGPTFLDSAYQSFNLNREAGDYASLDERKEILQRAGMKLDTLSEVYRTANLAAVIGHYSYAIKCYDYITKSYQNKEILNNIGVQYLLNVSQKLKLEEVKFAVPLMLDLKLNEREDIRIGVVMGSGDVTLPPENETEAQKKERLEKVRLEQEAELAKIKAAEEAEAALALKIRKESYNYFRGEIESAIEYFDQALKMDKSYHVAMLNKSIAYYLAYIINKRFPDLNEFEDEDLDFARTSAKKAKQLVIKNDLKSAKPLANSWMQLAIVTWWTDIPKAKEYIVKADELLGDTSKIVGFNSWVMELDGNTDKVEEFYTRLSLDEYVDPNVKDELFDSWYDSNLYQLIEQEKIDWDISLLIHETKSQNQSVSYRDSLYHHIGELRETYQVKSFNPTDNITDNLSFFYLTDKGLDYRPETIDPLSYDNFLGVAEKRMHINQVVAKLGIPSFKMETVNGTLLRYDNFRGVDLFESQNKNDLNTLGIILVIDDQSLVENWVVYNKSYRVR